MNIEAASYEISDATKDEDAYKKHAMLGVEFVAEILRRHETEPPAYEEIIKAFNELSISMLPALLIHLVEISYKRNVWQPGGASRTIKKIEKRMNQDG